jgi:hypothetical protein
MNRLTLAAVVEARRSKFLLWLGVAATTLSLSTQVHAACNIRGEFCGNPAWAANAFSNPRDRVPEAALEAPTHQARPRKPEKIEKVVRERVFKEKVVKEKVVKEKIVKTAPPPIVKFADGSGRQFDPTSKVWFDGKSQCWWGKQQFTFKDGEWFYGKKEWIEVNGTWKAAGGESPELVSCESVPSFAAKANAIAAKTATQTGKREAENADKGATSQPAPATPRPVKIKTADGEVGSSAQKLETPAASSECKKYFPSVGQMISVPCAE